tara:strand:+ start:58 stop:309 length:252 start_codon:yes stop_codon:yes gene_type:complete
MNILLLNPFGAGYDKAIKSLFYREFVTISPGTRSIKVNVDNGWVFPIKEVLNDRSDFLGIGIHITESLNPLRYSNQTLDGIEL